MRVHVITHVPYEGPALVAEWADERGHRLTQSRALTEEYPPLSEVDLLVIMGGPMGVGDEDRYPWLTAEKCYLGEALSSDVRVFGVCLGAQLIVEVAGGSVYRADHLEIGWYEVRRTDNAWLDPVFAVFPESLVVGHWHGDTFSLPGTSMPLLSSDACVSQAFTLEGGRVVGLQFHLEWTPEALGGLVTNAEGELDEKGPWVMGAEELLEQAPARLSSCRKALFGILDALCRGVGG